VTTDSAATRRAFLDVREWLFPRWRAGATWQVRRAEKSAYHRGGYCHTARRLIYVAPHLEGIEAREVLVHEICHAVTGAYHGTRFQRRLLAAARVARKRSPELAEAIEKDLRDIRDSSITKAHEVYTSLYDAVSIRGLTDWRQLVRWLAYDHARSPGEMLSRFRRMRSVYESALRERQESLDAERVWRERIALAERST